MISFEPYSPNNIVGCIGLSNDKLQMDQDGVEVSLSFNNSSTIIPWLSFALSAIDSSVEIDAPLQHTRERRTVNSSGSIQTISFGLNYELNENLDFNLSSSYTPLDVQRPVETSGNDNFWNIRLGLSLNY